MSGECVLFMAFRAGMFEVASVKVVAFFGWVVVEVTITWWDLFEEWGVAKGTADFLSSVGVEGGVFESGRAWCELVVVGKVIENYFILYSSRGT